jgi:peptidoglycan/xylan/chitin deacetylase (PgdA/CDA1 family)
MMNTIAILMYHQIDRIPARGVPLRGLCVSPMAFGRQMRVLKLLGYRGLSMPQLTPYLRRVKTGKVFGITFDDGFESVIDNALPILLKEGFSATCFAVSGKIGGVNDWDATQGVDQKRLMNIDQWRHWLSSGMDIGSHTMSHQDIVTLSAPKASAEILNSRSELEDIFQVPVKHFCYPYGRFKRNHEEMVAASGYETAVTTMRGKVSLDTHELFSLPRVMIRSSTTSIHAASKLIFDR